MPATFLIAIALLLVVVTRRFAPITASLLGIAVAAAIGVWGTLTFRQGGGMSFAGTPIPKAVFFGFVLLLIAFEALNLALSLRRRRRLRHREEEQAKT